ncbi:MAG: TIM barrel protein [Bacteroidales bacterium]
MEQYKSNRFEENFFRYDPEISQNNRDTAASDFSDRWKQTVEDAATCGQKYVVTPWFGESIRRNYDDFMAFMDVFNKCGELCNKRGMKFGYRNYDFEFSEKFSGESLFDIMMRSIDPGLVVVQLDTGNLYNGGAIARDVADRYSGRFEFVHLKDVNRTGEESRFGSTIIGEGVAGVREVLKMIENTGGALVIIIEQEAYQGKTPMECARLNPEIMKNRGYMQALRNSESLPSGPGIGIVSGINEWRLTIMHSGIFIKSLQLSRGF